MKTILLTSSLLGSALGLSWRHEFSTAQLGLENMHGLFQAWRFEHSKLYASIDEEVKRFGNFKDNMERIASSNDEFYAGELTYRLGMNHFGDLDDDEFHAIYHNEQAAAQIAQARIRQGDAIEDDRELPLPGSGTNWVSKGKVTKVRDQENCGSCWAFSAAATMECNYAIAHGVSPVWLSTQQLVDCDRANGGCSGGFEYTAWDYARKAGGLCKDRDYSYTGREGSCKESKCTPIYKPKGYTGVGHTEKELASAIDKGCVSLAIEADQFAFSYYSDGVFTGKCGTRLDHAVMGAGYGVKNGQEYWLVKNSWGPNWGESGYIWICKNCGKNGNYGNCGVAMDPHQVIE